MKRSNWLWFVGSGLLAILAGVAAILALIWMADRPQPEAETPGQPVVVAQGPISAQSTIRADMVRLEERNDVPSGAINEMGTVLGGRALRDIAEGEVLRVQDVQPAEGDQVPISSLSLGNDHIAVALPADDVLSQWGAVAVGDHVDVLLTLDVILESAMYPEEVLTLSEGQTVQRVERDQSMDNVSVLVLQNLEVLRIIQEPQAEVQQQNRQDQEEQPIPPRKALILKVSPQDAVLLKYFRDSTGQIDLALRLPDNGTLFDVDPVNINYLIRRYGITLPEPLE